MTSDDFMRELEAEAADVSSVPTEGDTARLRTLAAELVATEREMMELERLMKERSARRNELRHKEIPDIMAEINQDSMGLPDVGEFGADLVSEPYYHANIAADWDEERRTSGFEHLEELGGGDVVRSTITVQAGRGDLEPMRRVLNRVRQIMAEENVDGSATLSLSVPWNTLTAFVKEWWSRSHGPEEVPMDKDRIGATVGVIAKIKMRKGKK